MLFGFYGRQKKEKKRKEESLSSRCDQLQISEKDRQTDGQADSFFFYYYYYLFLSFAKIVPVKLCVLKFYLEVSTSPSGCVLAVIALSISAALACLHLLPLVKPWQKVRGEER